MRIVPFCSEALGCLLVPLLFVAVFCNGEDMTVEVVGVGECANCAYNKIEPSKAFSGLGVTIDCKAANGVIQRRGEGKLDQEGKFKASLPHEIVKNGELKEECFAQLHSATSIPCPAYYGPESTRIVFKSQADGKHTFGPSGKLTFSPEVCASAFFWLHHKHKLPPFSKSHPWHKPVPKVYIPPLKGFGHPKFKKPYPIPKILPPPLPIHKKPHPVPKILPPPLPIHKKPHPVPKILPPPLPIHKKPLPPLVPVYKPKPPVFETPAVPAYKKPPIHKTLPPFPKVFPIHKKPCPPLPKLPSLPKLPPIPKIPLEHFKHPEFGPFPPLPPLFPYSP